MLDEGLSPEKFVARGSPPTQPHRPGYWDIDVETLVATAADDLRQTIAELEGAISTVQQQDSSS